MGDDSMFAIIDSGLFSDQAPRGKSLGLAEAVRNCLWLLVRILKEASLAILNFFQRRERNENT